MIKTIKSGQVFYYFWIDCFYIQGNFVNVLLMC